MDPGADMIRTPILIGLAVLVGSAVLTPQAGHTLQQIEPARDVRQAEDGERSLRLQRSPSQPLPVLNRLPQEVLDNDDWLDELGPPGRTGEVVFLFPGDEQAEQVPYEIIDGYAVHGGDIILGTEEEILAAEQAASNNGDLRTVQNPLAVQNNTRFRWPGGVLVYQLAEDLPPELRADIEEGISLITDHTDLVLVERTTQRHHIYVNYKGSGCWSHIGRRGGRQTLGLSDDCGPGSVAHEFLHAAGFRHEQQRADRNDHVRVIWNNIRDNREHNFHRYRHVVALGPYDYQSIMHYPFDAFGRLDAEGNKRTTLEPLVPGTPMGPTGRLTALDIAGIAEAYGTRQCVNFRPRRLAVEERADGWAVVLRRPMRSPVLARFGEGAGAEANARGALAMMRHYGIDEQCSVRLNDSQGPVVHFVNDAPPQGAWPSERCDAFDPLTLAAVEYGRNRWRVTHTLRRSGERRSYILAADLDMSDAYRLIDAVQEGGYRRRCFIGRGEGAWIYWRA